MAKREGYTQSKSVEVSSFKLFGRSQKDKVIRDYNRKGWVLVGDEVIGKNKHRLTFELPPKESANNRLNYIGCVAVIILIIAIANLAPKNTKPGTITLTATPRQRQVAQTVATPLSPTATRTRLRTSTPRPTSVSILVATPNAETTFTLTATPTDTNEPTNTRTPRPTTTRRSPTNTPSSNVSSATIYYAVGSARLRTCPALTNNCQAITVSGGTALEVIGNEDGDDYQGSTLWYIITYEGEEYYVHSKLVSRTKVSAPLPTAANNNNSQSNSGLTSEAPPLQSTPPPAPPAYTCAGDQYNCSNFTTCSEVMDYFNACPGDPSDLDRDKDGIPCEDLCG